MTLSQPSSGRSDLVDAARIAWAQALSDFYTPPLPDPVFEHDDDAASFFYIDDKTWTIHVNTAGVPHYMDASEAVPFLRSVCHHELQHYLVCPYDTVTSGMMFSRARRHVNDATAMFACNLFADLIVDSLLLKRFPRLTHDRILASIHDSAMRGEMHSDLWLLIVSCYRSMWGFPVPPSVKIAPEIYESADAIVDIIKKYRDKEQRWPNAVEKIAKILAKWQPPAGEELAGTGVGIESRDADEFDKDRDDERVVMFPLDVDAVMGSPVEVRNGDVARRCMSASPDRDMDEELERLAIDIEARGGTLEDLRAVLVLLGAGTRGRDWTRFWYRAKVRHLIRFDIHERRPSGATPLTPQLWRLGDPIEELDIVQSLQAFPVLIPNMSTRQWLRVESFSTVESVSPPDLLLVIDSSGSMTWSMSRTALSGEYHLALISALGAMNFAFSRGCRVAAINFSVGSRISKWTRDRRKIEDTLLSYEGGGTIMPVDDVVRMCEEAKRPVLVLMITDAEIDNWSEIISAVKKLSNRGNHIFMFHIGASDDDYRRHPQKGFIDAGGRVIPVSDPSDLVGLVLRDARAVYGRPR